MSTVQRESDAVDDMPDPWYGQKLGETKRAEGVPSGSTRSAVGSMDPKNPSDWSGWKHSNGAKTGSEASGLHAGDHQPSTRATNSVGKRPEPVASATFLGPATGPFDMSAEDTPRDFSESVRVAWTQRERAGMVKAGDGYGHRSNAPGTEVVDDTLEPPFLGLDLREACDKLSLGRLTL